MNNSDDKALEINRNQGYVIHVDNMDGDVCQGPVEVCNSIYHALKHGAEKVSVKLFGEDLREDDDDGHGRD